MAELIDTAAVKGSHDCREVARRLGMRTRGKGKSVKVLCPVHDEKTASCNVSVDFWHCFGCGANGDVIDLVRESMSVSFEDACEWLGAGTCKVPARDAEPVVRPYPPWLDVRVIWEHAGWTQDDEECSSYLDGRAIDPMVVDDRKLAFNIMGDPYPLPGWARWWPDAGFRLGLELIDSDGFRQSWVVRNVRYKKTHYPSGGYGRKNLVLANWPARRWLAGKLRPNRIILAEGEIDFLTWATRYAYPVIGTGSGMWGIGFGRKVPHACEVVCATHHDDAGEKYFDTVRRSLRGRPCRVVRWWQ